MNKPKLKPPPNDKGNLKGRLLEDRVLAKQSARVSHDFTGLWEKAPDKVLKLYGRELARLQEARKLQRKKRKSRPKPKPPSGPISFFKFAKGRE